LLTLRRGETVEEWFPIVVHDTKTVEPDYAGELNLCVKVDEQVVLPSEEYDPVLQVGP
jgi:hypothetical protein